MTPFGYRRWLARLAGIAAITMGTALAAPPVSTSSSATAAPEQQDGAAIHAPAPDATPASFEDVLREQDPSDAWLSLSLMGGAVLAVGWVRSRRWARPGR